MLVGAVMGFWAVQRLNVSGSLSLAGAVGIAALAGAAMALIHAFLVITLRANQIVSGLALTIFAGAAGLSAYLGNDLTLADSPARYHFPSSTCSGSRTRRSSARSSSASRCWSTRRGSRSSLVGLYLARTRPGLNVRAVGESPATADAMGIDVTTYRYLHTLVGGALAGVAGACYSLQITPQWVTGITGGAGWIAIALVIFSFWRADLCLAGAYLFGAFSALPFALAGARLPPGCPVRGIPGASLLDDRGRTRDRLDRLREAASRRAGGTRPSLRA